MNNNIGENIKTIRKTKGLTQKQLGQLLGVSQAAIGQFESGKSNLTIDTIKKIAEALEVSEYELMYGAHNEANLKKVNPLRLNLHITPPVEIFNKWLNDCEIYWEEAEKNGKKGRLFHFESFGVDDADETFFVTEDQVKKMISMDMQYLRDRIRDYDEINRSSEK